VTETNAQYHADTEYINKSMMQKYRESPSMYDMLYVAQTIVRPPPTEAMVLGSLLHCVVLEPEKLDDLFLVSELKSRRGKGWDEFADVAATEDKLPVLKKHLTHANNMQDALLCSPIFMNLMEMDCEIEQSFRWTHEATGLKLKCKPDQRIYDAGLKMPICLDVKTSADPRPHKFRWQAKDFGYAWQASHYLDGCKTKTGVDHRFVFAVVGKSPPHDVYFYECDKNSPKVVDAYLEIEDTLAALKKSLDTNVWLAEGQEQFNEL